MATKRWTWVRNARSGRRRVDLSGFISSNRNFAKGTALSSQIDDIPEVNPHAVALVQKKRMQKVFETARMYNKKIPEIPTDRVLGVTSFELG